MTACECVEWAGNISRTGYGRQWVLCGDGKRRLRYAHRVAWEAANGPIPDGLTIDHLCRNKACVNTAHLEVVTRSENLRRAAAVVTHCPRGHDYTAENTYVRHHPKGWTIRACRACHRDRQRQRRSA